MVGSKQFTIQAEDFIKGMSTSPDIADAGFSTETTNINLLTKPGVIYAPAKPTDISTNLTGKIIASCGPYNTKTEDRYFVSSNKTYYSFNGTTLTLQKTASTGTYTENITDMVGFIDSVWVTTTSHLTKWNGTSTLNETFQALTNTSLGQPHPLLVWENNLWVGDGNLLHKMDTSESWSGSVLTLDTGVIIYALAIDPASGKMLISTSDSVNSSDTIKSTNKILIYNGFSPKPDKAIVVEDLVTAMYPVSGLVYVAYGINIGVFNGSGIDFKRQLVNATYATDSLVYKHRITSTNKNLYIADGSRVLCYGEVLGGQPKVFYYAYENKPSVTLRQISCLTGIGATGTGEKLAIASDDNGTYKLYNWSNTSRSTVKNAIFYSNKYLFPRPVFIRGVRLVFDGAVPTTSGETLGFFNFINDVGNSTTKYIYNAPIADVPYYDLDNPTVESTTFKCSLEFNESAPVFGIRQIMVFYDPAE